MSDPAEFDRFADNYDECLNDALAASGETKEFFARARVEWLAKCLAEFGLRARSVLDYGCGTGARSVPAGMSGRASRWSD